MKMIVIGDGIASWCLEYYFSTLLPETNSYSVTQISAKDLAPCSYNSTAVVSLQGVRPGTSELGDYLYNSYEAFEEFLKHTNASEITKARQYHVEFGKESSVEELTRRFGNVDVIDKIEELNFPLKDSLQGKLWPSYLVNPKKLEKKIKCLSKKNRESHNGSWKKIEKKVTSVSYGGSCWEVALDSGESLEADVVIVATGAYGDITLGEEFPQVYGNGKDGRQNRYRRMKTVPGDFLHWSDVPWGEKSFVLSFYGFNLVYNGVDKTVMVGGTTNFDQSANTNQEQLDIFLETVDSFFDTSSFWPLEQKAIIYRGLRAKAPKKLPLAQKINTSGNGGVYFLGGFYKSGMSYPFFLASKLAHKITQDHF
jgi:hypothetical protein